MVHVNSSVSGNGIDARYPRKCRAHGKSGASSHGRYLLKHCPAGNAARGKVEPWPGRDLRNEAAFTRIRHLSVPSFSLNQTVKRDARATAVRSPASVARRLEDVSSFLSGVLRQRLAVHGPEFFATR